MKKIIITIDGPAASGKGRIAKYISKKWKLKHLDSGILYRKLAKYLIDNNVKLDSTINIKRAIKIHKFKSFRNKKELRSEKISKISSKIAVFKFVRTHINEFQRNFVNNGQKISGFVIDGRDIGSVVFKNADLKLYIEASEENRAKRRYKQLIDTGEKSIYLQISKELKLRDNKDQTRKNSPLVCPRGAIKINNNGSFFETIKKINNLIKEL